MTSLMRRLLVSILLLVPTGSRSDCKSCKCTHYPVEPSCRDCCPVIRGTVKDVSTSSLTVSLESGEEQTFNFTIDSVVSGTPSTGTSVLVVFNRDSRDIGYVKFGN